MKDFSSAAGDRYGSSAQPSTGSANNVVSSAIDILRRRFKVLAIVAAVIFAILASLILRMTPMYEATAKIKLDPGKDAVIDADDKGGSNFPDQSLIDTEVSIMRSREVARSVVDRLHLDSDPEFMSDGKSSKLPVAQSREDKKDEVVDNVLDGLDVGREKATYLIGLSFISVDPAKAAKIANAFADAYLANTLQARTGTANQQAKFLDQRLRDVGADLATTDRQVAQYKAEAGIITVGDRGTSAGTVVDQQVMPLTVQMAQAESEAAGARAQVDAARAQIASGGLKSLSGVLSSPVVAALRGQEADVQKGIEQARGIYGPNHPFFLRQQQQLAELDAQIEQEAKRIYQSLQSDAAAKNAEAAVLRSRVAGLRGEQASNTRNSVIAQSLLQQADTKRETFNKIAAQQQQMNQVAKYTGTQARIVEAAFPPDRKSSPKTKLLLVVSFLFAGAAGLGTIVTQEILSGGLKTAADVENGLKIPFIVSIPKLKDGSFFSQGSRENPADIIIDTPVSPFAEAFRIARNTLLLAGEGASSPRIISMMSTVPDEGKTTSSLAMARVLATSGERVLLIDCDLRQNGLSRIIGNDGRPGLVELLSGRADLSQVVRKDRAPTLDIIPVPNAVFTAQDIFGTDAMSSLLKRLLREEKYDRIVLDTPPLLGVADARVLASLSDAAILLIRWNSTALGAIQSALAWLEADRAPLVGAMFTMVDPKSEAIGAMYYSKKYTKYYQQAR